MISIYDHTNYREYLKKRFNELKKERDDFSYRVFNRKAGIASSGFLKNVVDGKRNLATDGIRKIIKGLELKPDEGKYFESLVHFNQAQNHEDKDHYFQELLANKRFVRAHPLTEAQYNLFSEWYYVALLELIRLESRETKDILWIQRSLRENVPLLDIKKAVKDLIELGLVKEGKQLLLRKQTMLSTPDEVKSVSVANFHFQMGQIAAKALKEDSPQDREFSGLTVALSDTGFEIAKKELQKFRRKLHSLVEEDTEHPKTNVAHLNLQLFKVSKKGE